MRVVQRFWSLLVLFQVLEALEWVRFLKGFEFEA